MFVASPIEQDESGQKRFAGACLVQNEMFYREHLVGITWPTVRSIKVNTDPKETRLSPTLLLLSDDKALARFVDGVVKSPWKLVWPDASGYMNREVFAQPNVRLVVLDDHAFKENDRGRLLAQIRKHFSCTPLLYVAGIQSDENEIRARTNGAQYYTSKPLSLERFGYVLQSFLQAAR